MIHDVKRWDLYHKKTHKEAFAHSNYAEEKETKFPRSSLILELGGGTGQDALYFLSKGHSVILLDISEFALKVAQEKADDANLSDNLKVMQVDFGLHKLPVRDNSIDIAYSRLSLNYFPADQTTIIFKDIYRALKSGGHAYLTFKSPENTKEMEYLEKVGVPYEPGVYIESGQLRSRFTVDQLKEMLKQAGIPNFDVRLYRENLKEKPGEESQILILNEVVFTKA